MFTVVVVANVNFVLPIHMHTQREVNPLNVVAETVQKPAVWVKHVHTFLVPSADQQIAGMVKSHAVGMEV